MPNERPKDPRSRPKSRSYVHSGLKSSPRYHHFVTPLQSRIWTEKIGHRKSNYFQPEKKKNVLRAKPKFIKYQTWLLGPQKFVQKDLFCICLLLFTMIVSLHDLRLPTSGYNSLNRSLFIYLAQAHIDWKAKVQLKERGKGISWIKFELCFFKLNILLK